MSARLAAPARPSGRALELYRMESSLRRKGLAPVAGVDEAGRGACAGPLVVASCVLKPRSASALPGLDDSKRLSPAKREWLEPRIRKQALSCHVVVIPPEEVDQLGVHKANLDGMRRAVLGLATPPNYVLLDGFNAPGLTTPSESVIGGDGLVACIAAASVLAKVARDRIMTELDGSYPDYGFAVHKGYCTAAHLAALAEFGPCSEHRFSYAPVRAASLVSGPAGRSELLRLGGHRIDGTEGAVILR